MDAPRETLPSLPDDAEALRVLVLAAFAERDAVASERDAAVTERDTLQAQNDRLRHLLLKLTRMQFGVRSERLPEEQLQLGLEALEQAIAKGDAEAEKQNPELRKDNAAKRRASRGALPAHLPRIEVTLTPEDTACPCCRAAMTVIGEVRGTVAEGRVSPRSRAAGRDPGAVSGGRDAAAETCLPGLPGHRDANAGAGAVD
jgi:transposase